MKNIPFLALLMLLFVCCTEKNKVPTPLTENQIAAPIASEEPMVVTEMEDDKLRPTGTVLVGEIDQQYAIELFLEATDTPDNGCTKVKGNYHYLSSKKAMLLEGRWCLEKKTIFLERRKKGQVVERFEGNFTGDLSTVQGTWTKEGAAPLEVLLRNIEEESSYPLFRTALKDVLSEGLISIENIGEDAQGLFLESLRGDDLTYLFSPVCFSAISSYESTAVNAEISIDIFMEKVNFSEAYIAVVRAETDVEDYGDKEEEAEPLETYRVAETAVFAYVNGKIVNIFVEEPTAVTTPIYAILKKNKLLLVNSSTQEEQVLGRHPSSSNS